jgi:hypothetical protein
MTIFQFDELSEADQAAILWSQGQLVANREVSGDKVLLYQVDSFYVEVHKVSNEIERIFSFCNTDLLLPYLEKIDISPILQKT